MEIIVHLTDAPIDPAAFPTHLEKPGLSGARVEFRGVVRVEEAGRKIQGLRYEAYVSMAEKLMREIICDLAVQHPCQAVTVIHRHGLIPVGESAVHIEAWAEHRAEAFAMVMQFLDRLKRDVPIWKTEAVWA